MIDWAACARTLDRVLSGAGELAGRCQAIDQESPVYRNTDYPLTPLPVLVRPEAWERIREDANRYLALLDKVIRLAYQRREVMDFFDLDEQARAQVETARGLERPIGICRLDGYLSADGQRWMVLENNSDCPAGMLFTARLGRAVRTALASQGVEQLPFLPMENPEFLGQYFARRWRAFAPDRPLQSVVIFQQAGKSNVESQELRDELARAGLHAEVADPEELRFEEQGVFLGDRPLQLIWNKINTCYWAAYAAARPALVARLNGALARRHLCHLNAFSARYLTESKLCAALLQEDRFRELWTPEEQALVARLLPWSRKLQSGKTEAFAGRTWDLVHLATSWQARFVVKQPYDIRGDGVTIGSETDSETWRELIATGCRRGWLLQEYIPPLQYPVPVDLAAQRVVPMSISLDVFCFDGVASALGSKASVARKVNVFQGGRKLAVAVSRGNSP